MRTTSKHNHKHNHCAHEEVKYCPDCKVCYCLNCKEEWGKETIVYRDSSISWIPYILPTSRPRDWEPWWQSWYTTTPVYDSSSGFTTASDFASCDSGEKDSVWSAFKEMGGGSGIGESSNDMVLTCSHS